MDAKDAGKAANGSRCTLILTEGMSSLSFVETGIDNIAGRDTYGVFPLMHRSLNVRSATHDGLMKNKQLGNIRMTIMGLQIGENYEDVDVSRLRYGRLLIMAHQDHDGSHYKGLIVNFLDHLFP